MNYSFQSLLILFAIFTQNGNLFNCFAAPALNNEIPHGMKDVIKSFREEYALIMKSNMDTSVDPCDDFYEFACGNFSNAIEELDIFRKRSNHSGIKFVMNDLIEIILQKHRNPDEKFYREIQKVKQFYDSCLDAKLWPMEPKEEFLEVLNAIGGFPAIDYNWNASAFDWFNMTAHLSRYGIDGLIKEEISEEYPFPPYYELPKFGFGVDVYLENIADKKALGYKPNETEMRNLLKVYGVSRTRAYKIIADIFKFWREALLAERVFNDSDDSEESNENDDSGNSDDSKANASDDSGNSDENNDSDYSGDGADSDYSGYSDENDDNDDNVEFSKWNSFFETVWEVTKFPPLEMIACPFSRYFKKLDSIVSKRSEAVANYMALKFLFEIHQDADSVESQRTLCLNMVKHEFPILLSHLYFKEHYNKAAEVDINEIISEVKVAMRNIIKNAKWLDKAARLEALRKLHGLKTRVGEVVDPITEIYIKEIINLNLTNNFATNTLKIFKFNVDRRHYVYLHPNMPKSTPLMEDLNAFQDNAFYSSVDNSFTICADYLHPPQYHPYLPKFLNYGVLGGTIGHEISHAFDLGNSKYDSNLTERIWWTEKSSHAFQKRVDCFIQHYSDYIVSKIKLNIDGTISQNENIADIGGLLGSLSAYRRVFKDAVKKKVEKFVEKESLPGFDMTPDQMFFLSFAQQFCSDNNLEDFRNKLTSTHPWPKYRVVGPLQNSEDFALVFNCSEGSRMNPNKKCHL